jgi:hypothetical protein
MPITPGFTDDIFKFGFQSAVNIGRALQGQQAEKVESSSKFVNPFAVNIGKSGIQALPGLRPTLPNVDQAGSGGMAPKGIPKDVNVTYDIGSNAPKVILGLGALALLSWGLKKV